jgi:hypothetical protein
MSAPAELNCSDRFIIHLHMFQVFKYWHNWRWNSSNDRLASFAFVDVLKLISDQSSSVQYIDHDSCNVTLLGPLYHFHRHCFLLRTVVSAVVKWLAPLCVPEVQGLNLSLETAYPYHGFLWSSSVPPVRHGDSALN